jgi:hypothetical protein
VENGRVLLYYTGEKYDITNINQITSSSDTGYGEMSDCLQSGEWWTLPAAFMNYISSFLILWYYEVKLRLRFKMNTLYKLQENSRRNIGGDILPVRHCQQHVSMVGLWNVDSV